MIAPPCPVLSITRPTIDLPNMLLAPRRASWLSTESCLVCHSFGILFVGYPIDCEDVLLWTTLDGRTFVVRICFSGLFNSRVNRNTDLNYAVGKPEMSFHRWCRNRHTSCQGFSTLTQSEIPSASTACLKLETAGPLSAVPLRFGMMTRSIHFFHHKRPVRTPTVQIAS